MTSTSGPASSTPRVALIGAALACLVLPGGGCPTDPPPDPRDWDCIIPEGKVPDYRHQVGCLADFHVLASRPLDASIPGARSGKTVVDQADDNTLYFQNSEKFQIHWEFASAWLSGNGLPPVGDLGAFNMTEYYSPSRRFILGALTHYEGPDKFVYEIAPYDTAGPDMVEIAFDLIRDNTFCGEELYFHPTSANLLELTKDPAWPEDIPVITTEELFDGITYQPLNLGESYGQLRFFEADQLLSQEAYVGPRDVAVLDRVPNDISVVAGLITSEMQTPLSHVNVLSQNRGTPNMALRGAFEDEDLRALEDRWVRFEVGPFDYVVEECDQIVADKWWEAHKPEAVSVPELDLTVTDLRDIELLTVDDIPAFGGKASNYGVMATFDAVPSPKAFAIPVYYYKLFEEQNGFDERIDAMLVDEEFLGSPAVRDHMLEELREDMRHATIDAAFLTLLEDKINTEYPGLRMRFRSSTNAEDLDGFSGAGLYTSESGDPNDPERPVEDALRTVWAALWNFRAFEERTYNGIDHRGVAMAMLCHHSFPDEEANGVALTANMFDETQPGFYINVQYGGMSVVLPDPGVTVDSFLYYYYYPGQPAAYFSYSNLIPPGHTVLTPAQTYELGRALDAIHMGFQDIFAAPGKFYAMDVEFKFDDDCWPEWEKYYGPDGLIDQEPECNPGERKRLWVKQARPHPGWGGGG